MLSRDRAKASSGTSRPFLSRSIQLPEFTAPSVLEFQKSSASVKKFSRNGELAAKGIGFSVCDVNFRMSRHQDGQSPTAKNSPSPSDSNKAYPWLTRKDSKMELEGIYSISMTAASCEKTSSTESPVSALARRIFHPAAASSDSRAESISHVSTR